MIPAQPSLQTGTAVVNARPCNLIGFYVSSTSSGTLIIHDKATAAANAISGTITPAIGFHRFPAYCRNGCYITIAVQPMDITFFFAAG